MFVIEHASCGHTFETLMPNMIHTNYLLTEDGILVSSRPSQLAELSRSEFDPELFSHSTYDEFFVIFATKVLYLTFCDKMRQFLIWKWIEREEIKRK